MSTTGSVSKGCFVFKPKGKAGRKTVNADDYFPDGKENLQRFETYNDLWEDINTEIQGLQAELNSKIFENLLKFAQDAHPQFKNSRDDAKLLEIPTAALLTGVNTPDHALMFASLASMIKEKVTPHVVMLRSKDCTNMKQTMIKTVTQLMEGHSLDLDESTDQDKTLNIKKINCTIKVLSAWYADKVEIPHSPRKKKKAAAADPTIKYPPIAILLEDLEAFRPHVLQDFITVCNNHLCELPVVLIFGIATTVTAVHRLLPHQVSSLLCMEKFQAPPSTDYLTLVIKKVLMTPRFPFKLGGKIFQLLLDMFLYHDFSVLNFIRGLQFAMMEHFYRSPLSILCCSEDVIKPRIKCLTHQQLEQLRQAVSLRSFVESKPAKEQVLLLTDDTYFKNVLNILMESIFKYHKTFYPILECLHTLTRGLPKHPLGKQLRETYSYCITSNIHETEKYKEAMELLRTMSRDELVTLLKQCADLLSSENLKELQDITKGIKEFIHKFENIEDLSQIEENGTETNSGADLSLPKKTDMHTLRKTLLEKKKKKLTIYEALRNEAIDYCQSVFRTFLKCPRSLPMYETVYYDSASDVRQHVNASPRAAIQTALSNPYVYLQNADLEGEIDGISNKLPDICIVYKLHLECGRLINLYDWLQAFVTVVTVDESDEVIASEQKQPSTSMQARFIRAVSELQFIGFIKPTKRKTDHVARLTWGGC